MNETRKKDVNLELDHETKGSNIQLVTSERKTNKLCSEGSWTYDFLYAIKILELLMSLVILYKFHIDTVKFQK